MASPDVEELLAQLRDDELVMLLSGTGMWQAGGVPRLGLPPLRMSDGPHGMRGLSISGDDGAALAPCSLAMAATFDESLINEVGQLIGEECAKRGGHVLLGPCVNMQRTPLCGRHFECFSEDPYLTARAAVAYIKGVQQHVAACAKHFVCNDQETNRHTMKSVIDERTLFELYLPPFEAAVKEAGVESIMCGYNRLNGYFCVQSNYLLQKVLRDQWGYKGWIVSDWFGNHTTVPSLEAGLNVEMPGIEPRHYGGYLLDAVRSGQVPIDLLKERCRPVLQTLVRHSGVADPGAKSFTTGPRRQELLRRAATASMVLLKNSDDVLPLDASNLRSVAILGPNAAEAAFQGGGSCRVRPSRCTTILEAIRGALPSGLQVLHEPGCFASESRPTTPEFEALRVIAGCDASGQAVSPQIPTTVADGFLAFAARVARNECFRRYVMPVARVLGVRTPDPLEVAAKEAAKKRAARGFANRHGAKIAAGIVIALVVGMVIGGVPLWLQPYARPCVAVVAVIVTCLVLIAVYKMRRSVAEKNMMEAAVQAAQAADVCLLVLGTDGHLESEGMDQPHMRLPARQNELAERVIAAARGPVVVVLNVGSPKELPWIESVSAVLLAHFGGQELGAAVADILLGKSNPAGRLPTTWPRRLEDSPTMVAAKAAETAASAGTAASDGLAQNPAEEMRRSLLQKHPNPESASPGDAVYSEGLLMGYRGFGKNGLTESTPLFSFGHGLSYTSWSYGPLEAELTSHGKNPKAVAKVRVKNTGQRAGQEVVQLYVESAGVQRALRGFARTAVLEPGQEQLVTFELDSRGLASHFSVEESGWLLPKPGSAVNLEAGASFADVRASATLVLK